ncbi:MAG: BrnA antitoxin family protein [Mariprofundaceae bacterium]|nr:BrnA antitoxin family protein [Mariprofundaceae bacterium]
MKDEYSFAQAKKGAVVPSTKQRITIRLDADIVDYFKQQVEQAGGGNYQAEINAALKDHITGLKLVDMVKIAVHEAVHEELHPAA